jgi:hypothetical protein
MSFRADNFEEVADLKFVRSLLLIGCTVSFFEPTVLKHLVNLECINMDRSDRMSYLMLRNHDLDMLYQLLIAKTQVLLCKIPLFEI